MNTEKIARVVFPSPLPALAREFEYQIPAELGESIAVGCRVSVKFAGQTKEGFVVAIGNSAEFSGKLSPILSVVSSVPVLQPHVYQLLKAVAARQCCSVGELIESAVPKRSVRVEKSFSYSPSSIESLSQSDIRLFHQLRPVSQSNGYPGYLETLLQLASTSIDKGVPAIIAVPDFRDLALLEMALTETDLRWLRYEGSEVGSTRYSKFLQQLAGDVDLVIGTRSVIYSPMSINATLIIWDDGDQSHQDQQSPYLATREIALVRQSLSKCELHFVSHAISTEVVRLLEIGYLKLAPLDNWRPKVFASEGRGLDGASFKLIKRALDKGSVLFQVSAPGTSRSLYCAGCGERSNCSRCHGPLWVNASSQTVCRWCGQLNLHFVCAGCGDRTLRQGAAGATRWVEQLGKSFPGVPIREVIAEADVTTLKSAKGIVVSTPGIEPVIEGGYSAVVFIDCQAQLSRDSLRAPEDGLRNWLNALAFMNGAGESVAVGLTSEVERALTLGEVRQTASQLLQDRVELGLPPALRFLTAEGDLSVLELLKVRVELVPEAKVLGIAKAQSGKSAADYRLMASFPYSAGPAMASQIQEFSASLGTKQVRVSAKSGKNLRPVTIKFDDPRVI